MGELGEDTGAVAGEDEVPEPPADPVTRPGDLWVLGRHRLLCGDATVATDVERLLDGAVPHLMVTDPPFGVNYDPTWRTEAGVSTTSRTGKVANDHRADWRDAWALFPGDVAYVWHAGVHASTVADSLVAAGFGIRADHLGQAAPGLEPRALSLAARTLLVCGARRRDRTGSARPDHDLGDRQCGSRRGRCHRVR
jgi:hypothetical protein